MLCSFHWGMADRHVECRADRDMFLSVSADLDRAAGHDNGIPEEGGPAIKACALCRSFLGERGLLRSLTSPPLQNLGKP